MAYVLTTFGAIRLVFIQRKMQVPQWEVVIPIGALVVLGYTLYRNVIPYDRRATAVVPRRGRWLAAAVDRRRARSAWCGATARRTPGRRRGFPRSDERSPVAAD